jgi:hypothetical protein
MIEALSPASRLWLRGHPLVAVGQRATAEHVTGAWLLKACATQPQNASIGLGSRAHYSFTGSRSGLSLSMMLSSMVREGLSVRF